MQTAHDGLPATLSAWLNKKNSEGLITRDLTKVRLTLGPENASFFVTDGNDYLWCNLPSGLNETINKCRNLSGGLIHAPRLVALGVKGNFIFITTGNGGSWVLGEYPELEKFVRELKAAYGDRPGMFASVAVCLS